MASLRDMKMLLFVDVQCNVVVDLSFTFSRDIITVQPSVFDIPMLCPSAVSITTSVRLLGALTDLLFLRQSTLC